MSHHLYNPYVSGEGTSTQGQYGFTSKQSEGDPWRAPHHYHGSSFSSLGIASAASSNLGGTIPPPSSRSESYKPEQSRVVLDKDKARSGDFYIGNARERSRHQPVNQEVYMSSTQRDKRLSSSKEVTSHPESSTFKRHGHSESDGSSLDRFGFYKSPIKENSSKLSSASSSYPSRERQHDVQAIPGLGDANNPVQDKTMPPKESQHPKYAPEVAVNILQKFGLGKEDLKYLLSYPEDQITSDNLPLILRQIRIQKEKRASTHSKSSSQLQPIPTTIDKNSEAFDHGLDGRYRANRGESGSLSGLDAHRTSRKEKSKQHNEKEKIKEPLLQPKALEEPQHELPACQMGQVFQPNFLPPSNPFLPPYFNPSFVAPPSPLPQFVPGWADYSLPPQSGQFLAEGPLCSGPTQDMINDYAATPPTTFPHVCSLCNVVCPTMKDWFPHQNTSSHLENCKLLRKRFPQWDGNADHFLGDPSKNVEPFPSTSWPYNHENTQHERRSPSHSPWYYPTRSKSRTRSSSRSSSPRRHHDHMSQRLKHSSQSRSKCSSGRSRRGFKPDNSPLSSHQSRSRSNERRPSSSRMSEKGFTPRKGWEKPSVLERSSSKRRSSSSAEMKSSSRWFDLETVAQPMNPKVAKNNGRLNNKEENSPATMVKLTDIHKTLTHAEVLAAVKTFGKVSSVLLYRSRNEANVNFEKEEDAEKLRSCKNFCIDEIPVKVVSEKANVQKEEDAEKLRSCKNVHTEEIPDKVVAEKPADVTTPPTSTEEQTNPPQQESAESSSSTTKTSKPSCPEKMETAASSSSAGKTEAAVKWRATPHYSEDPVTSLTVGEMVETQLRTGDLRCYGTKRKCLSNKVHVNLVLISNLPEYTDGLYKEEDVAELLYPFGFRYRKDQLYIIPQKGLAVALMPSVWSVKMLVDMQWGGVRFKEQKLCIRPLNTNISMTLFGFYKSLMHLMHFRVTDDGERIVCIENISVGETKELRKVLRKVVSIKNFLPLLNKLYVEFGSREDADQLGLLYSQKKKDCRHKVLRLSTPRVPLKTCDDPLKTTPPFWITIKARPYIFPTASPRWSNPAHLTVNTVEDVQEASSSSAPQFNTVMLTGFPDEKYEHEDIAKLMWPFLAKKDLPTRLTDVVVLPLQKRAIMYFSNWQSCYDFVVNHVTNQCTDKRRALCVHVVLEEMELNCSEVNLYRNLMKWSNSEIPDPVSLESRMLSIEISTMFVDFVPMVMEAVAAIASFVNFLPLSDRIYVEMSSSSGALQVSKRFFHLKLPPCLRSKVVRIQLLKEPPAAAEGQTSETSSEMHPDPPGQQIKVTSEAQRLEADFQEEKSLAKERKRDEDEDGRNDETLDSLKDQTDEVPPEEGSETDVSLKNETFVTGQMSKEYGIQSNMFNEAVKNPGLDTNNKPGNESSGERDEGKILSEDAGESRESEQKMEEGSEGCTEREEHVSQQDSQVDEEEVSMLKQTSDGDATHIVNCSDKSADSNDGQSPKLRGDGEGIVEDEEKEDSEESSHVSEDAARFSDGKNQPAEDRNSNFSNVSNEQEASETLESVDKPIITEDDRQRGTDQISKAEEDARQIINPAEDQPTTTETESVAVSEDDNVTPEGGVRPTQRGCLRSTASESEEKSPKQQDGTVKHDTPTKDVSAKDKKCDEDTEETADKAVDSGQEILSTIISGRRTTRGNRGEKPSTGLDSVEDELIVTRSTRGRRGKPKTDSGDEETTTLRRNTPGRGKTAARPDEVPPLGDRSEEEVVEEDQPATPVKSRRGRAKKTTKKLKPDGQSDKLANETRSEAETQERRDESDSVKPVMLLDVNEAGSAEGDDEDKAGKTSVSAKRKHDHDTEEEDGVMMMDEVAPTNKRGRPRKKPRNTPVRKSTRGKKASTEDEREENESCLPDVFGSSSTPDKDTSTLSTDVHKTDQEAEDRSDVSAASAGQKTQSETLKGCEEEEGYSTEDVEVGEQRGGGVGPEAKRARSQSPVADNLKLSASDQDPSLGL